MFLSWLRRWGPALLMMAVIFAFSSQPASELPRFGSLDYLVKKGGHALGYALLAIACWRGLYLRPDRAWLAWLIAVCYSATDEFHQSFVPGRHPAIADVLLFDNVGAIVGLLIWERYQGRRRSE